MKFEVKNSLMKPSSLFCWTKPYKRAIDRNELPRGTCYSKDSRSRFLSNDLYTVFSSP